MKSVCIQLVFLIWEFTEKNLLLQQFVHGQFCGNLDNRFVVKIDVNLKKKKLDGPSAIYATFPLSETCHHLSIIFSLNLSFVLLYEDASPMYN